MKLKSGDNIKKYVDGKWIYNKTSYALIDNHLKKKKQKDCLR